MSDEPDASFPDPTEVASRRLGEIFAGKWRIERVLGSGGMATVYAAVHTNNQRAVALKVLHAELTASGDIKKRFLREGFIANRVGHPGAVAILDDGLDDAGNVFLVMELLTGASVADRMRAARSKAVDSVPGRAFDEVEALRVADGVLDVLAAAHAQGIVHRDLKPDNVFVTDLGVIKVLDFGIARLREAQSGETPTLTGVLLGTPQYMPPEQARGRSSLVDARSDLWAVGALVFTMLTGRHVHEAETPNESLLKAMTATAPALASLLPGVDPRVAAIVDRALAFDQAMRYPDAPAMRAEVREAMALLGSGAANLPPTSAGGALSGPRPVTAVSKSATPVVRDANGGGSAGLRVLAVILFIGLSAIGGRALVGRLAPGARVTSDARASAIDAAFPATTAAAAPGSPAVSDGGVPLASEASPLPDAGTLLGATPDASLLLDAGTDADRGDADEESNDDGGDEADEVTLESSPQMAGRPPHAGALLPHPATPAHNREPPKKRKKTKKKR